MADVIFDLTSFKADHPDIWKAAMAKMGLKGDPGVAHVKDGSKGSVYALGAKEVVKFTTDIDETKAMAKVAGQDTKHIVHVTQVFKLPYPKVNEVLGVIRQERLQPGDSAWKRFGELATFYFSQVIKRPFDSKAIPQFKLWATKRLGQAVHAADETTRVPPLSRRKPGQKPPEDVMVFHENDPDQPWGSWVDDSVKMPTDAMFTWFDGLCQELKKFKISFYDLNAGNMMRRGSTPVVVDLGLSQVEDPPDIDDELVRMLEHTAAMIEAMAGLGLLR
jgi:hypothetical protein